MLFSEEREMIPGGGPFSSKGTAGGLPITEADTWFCRRLLELGGRNTAPQPEQEDYAAQDPKWLKDLARQVSFALPRSKARSLESPAASTWQTTPT